MTEAQDRLRAKRTREARAERARLDAAHEAEFAREMAEATRVAAEANGLDPEVVAAAPDPLNADRPTHGRRLKVTRGTQVKTRRVNWLVPEWIPRGALTLLAGREGLGKSTLACWWAAWRTRLGENVVYIHTEDSREHTVAPRLRAAGADMSRVLFVDVETETTDTGTVVLPLDNDRLEELVADERVTFVVLDAATSAMHSALSGKDDRQVRQFLEPLAQMAARLDIVVLGLVHFGKRDGADTGKLILGSIAWSQVARSVLSVALDEDAEHLVVTNTKGNLATRTRSEGARIVSQQIDTDDGPTDVGTVEWLGEVTTDARELLGGDDAREQSAGRDELRTVLRDVLADLGGQAPAADVLKAMRAAGFDDNTVKKARAKAGVRTTRVGFGKGATWQWTIEAPIDPAIDSIDSHARERESMESMARDLCGEDSPEPSAHRLALVPTEAS